jgi:hypothetical protein
VVIGFFIWNFDGQFSPIDINSASSTLDLPVYFLNEQGLFRTKGMPTPVLLLLYLEARLTWKSYFVGQAIRSSIQKYCF